MNARYKSVVFDEWAVVSIAKGKLCVLEYAGLRPSDFRKQFLSDAGTLRAGLLSGSHEPGYFEFAHTGVGTGFESFMALGEGNLDELFEHAPVGILPEGWDRSDE